MKGKFSLRTCKCAQFAKLTLLSRGYPNASRGYPNASEINAKKVISGPCHTDALFDDVTVIKNIQKSKQTMRLSLTKSITVKNTR